MGRLHVDRFAATIAPCIRSQLLSGTR